MCNFFTCIVTTKGQVLFTEEDSHDTLIERTGLTDNLKEFVRIEYTLARGYVVDEMTIPVWYQRMVAKVREDVRKTYCKVLAPNSAMMKVRIASLNEYNAICTREQMAFDYVRWRNLCDKRWGEYWKIRKDGIQAYKAKIENFKGYVGPVTN